MQTMFLVHHNHHYKQWKLHKQKINSQFLAIPCGKKNQYITYYVILIFLFRYTCPLRNYNVWLSKKPCKWEGVIEDYINHVKKCHPENFFELQQKHGSFRWKLPYNEDQQDLGIIKDDTYYYYFEMFYAYNIDKLYFSLNCVTEELNSATEYEFHLKNTYGKTLKYIQSINNVKEIVKPIQERSTTTKLCKNEVRECSQYYRHIIWKIVLK